MVLRPPPSVGGVSVTVGYPDGEDHLPSTLSIPAAVRVSAEGDADGVKALLTTERGGFVGAAPEDASSLTLTLSAAQGGGAEAAAFVTTEGAEPGEALLTVTALERTGVARIRIAGPPLLTPAGGSLLAGGVQRRERSCCVESRWTSQSGAQQAYSSSPTPEFICAQLSVMKGLRMAVRPLSFGEPVWTTAVVVGQND